MKLRKSGFLVYLCAAACSLVSTQAIGNDACHVKLSSSLELESSSFMPLNMSFTPVLRLGREYLGTLVKYDAQARVVPMLAKSWRFREDGRAVTFKLDSTCKWSDATPITADQFVFGFRALFDTDTSFTANGGFAYLKEMIAGADDVIAGRAGVETLGVRALDDETLEIQTSGPADLFMDALVRATYAPVPTHWIADGRLRWPQKEIWKISSGPYVTSSVNNENIIFEQNPHFCADQRPVFKKATYVLNSPRQATVGLFLKGDIDAVDRFAQRYISPLLNEANQPRKHNLVTPSGRADTVHTYLFINQTLSELQDQRVKEAIALLIEYEFIASEPLFGSQTHILDSYMFKGTDFYPPRRDYTEVTYPERVERARALLLEAGYSEDRPLEIDLPLRENHEFYSLGRAIAGMLSKGFIKVNARKAGEGEDYYRNLDNRTFGVGLFMWGNASPDPSLTLRGVIDKRITSEDVHKQLHDLYASSNTRTNRVDRFEDLTNLEKKLREIGHIIPLVAVTRSYIIAEELELGDGLFLQASTLKPKAANACQ